MYEIVLWVYENTLCVYDNVNVDVDEMMFSYFRRRCRFLSVMCCIYGV